MIRLRCDLTITVRDEDVETAVRFLRKSAKDAIDGFHRAPIPHALEITTEDM